MRNTVVVGTQWGDEGKGKIVDLLSEFFDYVVRFQGGNNAGHTMVVNGKETITHLVPSGIIQSKICCIGNGPVVNPFDLLNEIDALNKNGITVNPDLLLISDRAHLILPYHIALDNAKESKKGEGKIGTTGKGIGPCYEDKAARRGIRFGDLFNPKYLSARIESAMNFHNFLLTYYYKVKPIDIKKTIDDLFSITERLLPFITDISVALHQAMDEGKNILFEGAQGSHLDIDHGTYPFVTSSSVVSGNAANGSGVGPTDIDEVIGIVKAYTTRVGEGPFPTELLDDIGDKIQNIGKEFGATTGRKRRCGWLDLAPVNNAVRLNGIANFAITKLDVLTGLKVLKICTGYKTLNGKIINYFPADLSLLKNYEPVYVEFSGWTENIKDAKEISDLPLAARDYLEFIQGETAVDIRIVSVGPDREQTIFKI